LTVIKIKVTFSLIKFIKPRNNTHDDNNEIPWLQFMLIVIIRNTKYAELLLQLLTFCANVVSNRFYTKTHLQAAVRR